ncbi:MAG: YbaK/EbsC family protein [Candidatus Nealsonbacteria bacterium]|nr:YbaK/EbsC family protein [Candidatus Nealsonbacteria bacterium]
MAIPKKVIKFLESAKVNYKTIKHRIVYNAFDKAATLRIPQKISGKTLVIKYDGKFVLVLIPANKNLDKVKFKKISKTKKIDFAKESWIRKNLKGVKVGAIPPFGGLWKLPTFIDRALLSEKKVVLNSGENNWSIEISSGSFKKLIPDLVIGSLSARKK